MAKIRVLLADDQELFANSLRIVLESRTDDMDVVGVARNGREAADLVDTAGPDVILMDVRMPEMDGVEATRVIHEKHPNAKIVMLTTYDDDAYVNDALRFGAVGYLLKSIPPSELIASVRAASAGHAVQISPSIAAKLLKESARSLLEAQEQKTFSEEVRELYDTLTRRERQVLALLSKAYDNRQIAETLDIADQTVKNHVHSIYEKLYVSNRMELIRMMKEVT